MWWRMGQMTGGSSGSGFSVSSHFRTFLPLLRHLRLQYEMLAISQCRSTVLESVCVGSALARGSWRDVKEPRLCL